MWFIFFFVLVALSVHVTAESWERGFENILAQVGRELWDAEPLIRLRNARPNLSISTPLGFFALGGIVLAASLLGALFAIRLLLYWLFPELFGALNPETSTPAMDSQAIDEFMTLGERVGAGGIIGYSILALGAVGLLIAIWRLMRLSTDSRKVSAQLERDFASTDNPLGRVIAAYESNKGADTETIELKLSEAALKEMPGLTKGLLFIKVISVVAPLMGLLGTVTGMIKTFQVITLYGDGDPELMAGGISQALMTTVLGLVVAIPMVLMHTIVSGQSKKIANILQSQSAELLSGHAEAQNLPNTT